MYVARLIRLLVVLVAETVLVLAQGDQRCNGFEALCDRSLGNITFIGAHDSFADLEADGALVGAGMSSNQYLNVSRQLADGVRMLQGQGHEAPGDENTVQLCHTSCALLDGGSLTSYLEEVRTFLDDNPDEVIILLWFNAGPAVELWADSYRESGMEELSYVPPSPLRNDEWPTLRELIEAGTRAITFMDGGADEASVPFILEQYSVMFESQSNPLDNSFPCELSRPPGQSPDGRIYLINHNLNSRISDDIIVPNLSAVNTTNAACGENTIEQHVDNCVALYGRNPNIIMLDYYDQPPNQPFEAANYLNGVGPNPCDENGNYVGVPPATTTDASSGSSPSPTESDASSGSSPSSTESDASDPSSSSGIAVALSPSWSWSWSFALGLAGVIL